MIINNLFFPPKCVFCKAVLPITHKLPNICHACEKEIIPLPVSTCKNCGKPKDAGYEKPFCLYCVKKMPDSSAVVSNFPYEPKVRQSILRFKFSNKPYYAKTYAYFIYERLKAYKLEKSFDAVVPAPISFRRLLKRGYNQTYLIARELSKYASVPTIKALKKIKHTAPQSSLPRKDRMKNLKDAIKGNPKAPVFEKALFIDDVYTTGTTASICAKELKKMGYRQVIIATVAINPQSEQL